MRKEAYAMDAKLRQTNRLFSRKRVVLGCVMAGCAAIAILLNAPQPAIAHSSAQIATSVDEFKHSVQPWIQIDLSEQVLTAWEGDYPIYSVAVSTGVGADATPTGVFAIQTMYRVARMRGEDYDIPDVPYTMYYSGNYAIHGAYWHDQFGTPVSHGCVNVAPDHARWLYNWATIGTPVVVQD